MRGRRKLLKGVWDHYVLGRPLIEVLTYFKNEFRRDGDKGHPLLWLVLDAVREELGEPIIVTSLHRGSSKTTHGQMPALAVDIRGWAGSHYRMKVVDAAREVGVSRIGLYWSDMHIHLDIGNLANLEQWAEEVMWLEEPPKEG
jgi:hypothetical protein